MNWWSNSLSVKSRLSLMLIIVTLLSSSIIGVVSWRNGQSALEKSIANNLTAIRSMQAFHIEEYFSSVFSHTRTLAEDRMIVNAMKQFQEGFEIGLYRPLDSEQNAAVTQFYDESFAPRLAKLYKDAPLSIMFRPARAVASYFQYHYLVTNPYPPGKKDLFSHSQSDTTIYSRFHRFYHPVLRNLQSEFKYYDLLLIDIKSLSVVYSVYKETDFATSLHDGPYRQTNLGSMANRIKENPERGKISIADFQSYAPSFGAPAAFIGAPIYDGNEAIGILAIQLPDSEIEKAITFDKSWDENGLGQTGATYIVGHDQLMRTNTRLFIENRKDFYSKLENVGYGAPTIEGIQNFDTTNMLLPVNSSSVSSALEENTGTHLTANYLGEAVLSSYSPLDIEGLDWVILSEISQAEALEPIYTLQRNILMWGVVLILAVALFSMLMSRFFVRPIDKLTAGVKMLSEGDHSAHIDIKSKDEFGHLANMFNLMVQNIKKQSVAIEQKNTENDRLLLNILPAPIAERLRAGERVVDQLQQVSIIHMHLLGFSKLALNAGATDSSNYLEEILNDLDDIAEIHDVERIKTMGDSLVAACGITSTRLDHARRVVEFAGAAVEKLHEFNERNHTALQLQIGIDSGSVTSGVIGSRQFNLEVWGEAVDVACHIHMLATPDSILVSNNVKERTKAYFEFSDPVNVEFKGKKLDVYEVKIIARVQEKTGSSVSV